MINKQNKQGKVGITKKSTSKNRVIEIRLKKTRN
jgi:hypothetical protein